MKLSMWMLLDELADYNPKSAIQDGFATIDGFRLFSHADTLSFGFVYIGHASDFFDINKNIVILAHNADMIFIDSGDAAEIINRIVSVFDKYRSWAAKLSEARHDPTNPYQAVLDAAHELFKCPMFFGNKNLQIYAITHQYTKEQVFEEWDDVKTQLTMPFYFLERWKDMRLPLNYTDDVDPAVFPWPSENFEYQIRTNCYFNGKVWGHFYLYYSKKEVSPAILQLARYVGDLFERMLQQSQEKNTEKFAGYSFLVELLNGYSVSQGTIQSFYWMRKWAQTDTLVLYRVAPSTTAYDQLLFFWLADSISEQAGDAVVFPYQNDIVIIARAAGEQAKILRDNIVRLISVNHYHCGISFTFKGLENIISYYRQAGYGISFAPDLGGKVHAFKDAVLEGLGVEMKTQLHWRDWIIPSLFALVESDASQGTAYYATLYHLLINKGHLGNTAKALYIHRNTLLYRLDKIGNLLDMDIHDERVWAYLRFCYFMMMEDYPITPLAPPAGKTES